MFSDRAAPGLAPGTLCVDSDACYRTKGRPVVVGWVVRMDRQRIADGSETLGRWDPLYDLVQSTLNSSTAELWGLAVAARKAGELLQRRISLRPQRVLFFSDSKGSVQLLSGQARGRAAYRPLVVAVLELCRPLPDPTFLWVPRAQNREADNLSHYDRTARARVSVAHPGAPARRALAPFRATPAAFAALAGLSDPEEPGQKT